MSRIENKRTRRAIRRKAEAGFSLVELMIASTLGLLILTTMITVFVSTSQSRDEVDKTNRQIENGRFAIEMLKEDIQLAAFYGDYMPSLPITWTVPDPCTTVLSDMGFTAATSPVSVPVGISGYADTETAPSCVTNRKAGTDVLVIRRASTTQLKVDANEDGAQDTNVTNEDATTGVTLASLGGAYYLQSSNCSDTPGEIAYVMAKTPASFVLHTVKPAGTPPNCMNGGLSPIRRYFVRIFYVATCNNCAGSGDGIPTLKMLELSPGTSACMGAASTPCGSMTSRSIAEGIENVQFEYGIDTAGSGGTPDAYSAAPTAGQWQDVTTVKIYLLARNTETTQGYTDTKTYSLASDGSTLAGTPFNDQYRRHVYAATSRAINIANRR